MNKKNRDENFKNASEKKPVNTSFKAGEEGYDPFSRRWTKSRNYFVSNSVTGDSKNGHVAIESLESGGGNGAAGVAGTTNVVVFPSTAIATGARRLVDTKAHVDQVSNFLVFTSNLVSFMFSEKMGGGGSGSASSSQYQCKWLDYPCVYPGCKLTRVVRKSCPEHSMGKRFLRCKGSPICSGFKWFDELEKELEKQKEENGKLKKPTEEEGKLKKPT
ncbi:hypothetical protein IFM89_030806 [Coptis chinensis]|uniref:Zinc finger GRF-type domain-containing protein n=1 Tax=Coptis chinensis TaxID=261450 RepID=A0A835I0X1_9MAGN|nr:hypothetical protein IFM89_030806 [Coptis chinensis]